MRSFTASIKKNEIIKYISIYFSFFFAELFAFFFLSLDTTNFELVQFLPFLFGAIWSFFLTCLVVLLPGKLSRIVYGIIYLAVIVYVGFQTGYNLIFSQMMWLSEFRYVSEGSDYASVLLSFPLGWWIGIFALIALGVLLCVKFPVSKVSWKKKLIAAALAATAFVSAFTLPRNLDRFDNAEEQSDFFRSQSMEAAYHNMYNAHQLYRVCGIYQTFLKDVYRHEVLPRTPSYLQEQEKDRKEINAYFSSREPSEANEMTGILAGKNVILILLESLDDWMIGEHTPTIQRTMEEGITFTNFYTPLYGGIRTFNSEFCMNTGSFLSSGGGYAFDYVNNSFNQSLASLLSGEGYSTKVFHFNSPDFYSRGEFSASMGYESYEWYANYMPWGDEETNKNSEAAISFDEQLLFDNEALNDLFFREADLRLNFVITKGVHFPYTYAYEANQFAFEKYPNYYGMTGHEETDCVLAQAKLLDDFFARLLQELEEKGELENTVIIGVTDHYAYGYSDKTELNERAGVERAILQEKTPCFIWSADITSMEVDKVLNTADILPTVLNMLGIDSPYAYIGRDAFDETYEGYVPFADGSWIYGDFAYDASKKEYLSISGQQQSVSAELQKEMAEKVQEFIRINNLILETDYYKGK